MDPKVKREDNKHLYQVNSKLIDIDFGGSGSDSSSIFGSDSSPSDKKSNQKNEFEPYKALANIYFDPKSQKSSRGV